MHNDDLFGHTLAAPIEILPGDGSVLYFGVIFDTAQADAYYQDLQHTLAWQHDEAVVYGKHYRTPRKVAWYADEPKAYTYSGITRHSRPWTDTLLQVKQHAEQITDAPYNACLANLYHDGTEGMAWHSDDERQLKKHGAIASLSFGARRKFAFKHKKTGQLVSLELEHGSLLLMRGTTQDHWLHRLPPTKKVHEARVNLTFRLMV